MPDEQSVFLLIYTLGEMKTENKAKPIVVSTINKQMCGLKILGYIPERNASDIYEDTYAVNASQFEDVESLAEEYGKKKAQHMMEVYLLHESINEYNRTVPESVFHTIRGADELEGGLSFEETKDLFDKYHK